MKKLAHAKFNSLPITQGDTEPFQLIKELAWAVTKLLYFSCNTGERVWTLQSGVCWLKVVSVALLHQGLMQGPWTPPFHGENSVERISMLLQEPTDAWWSSTGSALHHCRKKKNKWKKMLQSLLFIFFFCISTASLILNTCIPWNCAMHLNSSLPNLWDLRVMLPCQSSKVSSGVFQTRLSEIHFWEHQTFCSCIYSILLLQQISKTRGNK